MDLTQKDRDCLRAAQHRINSISAIGNIIEHPVQDPSKYKKASRTQEGHTEAGAQEPMMVKYESIYMDGNKSSKVVEDTKLVNECLLPDDPAIKWLNTDNVEFDKLEWMTEKARKVHIEKMKSSTHFDRTGRAVPSSEVENRISKGEQVHDTHSLINLLDSQYDPQVTYALNVVARICNLATLGYYDGAFDENIHQLLIDNCLLRVRSHIDSPNETICLTALSCLKSLLNNTVVDEVLLDRIYPLVSDQTDPSFWLKTIEMEVEGFDNEMKDSQCVEIDAINALIQRTDILVRFSNLLRVKQNEAYHELIIDIVTRMVRHSLTTCLQVMKSGILHTLVDGFLPSAITSLSDSTQTSAFKTLKVSRIVAQAINEIRRNSNAKRSHEIKLPPNLINKVKEYFFIDSLTLRSDQTSLFRIHIEAIRLVTKLLDFEEHRQDMVELIALSQEQLMTTFRRLCKLDPLTTIQSRMSMEWGLAAHLIDLVATAVQHEVHTTTKSSSKFIWTTFVTTMTLNWLNKIFRMRVIPHIDASIALARSIRCFSRFDETSYGTLKDMLTDGGVIDYIDETRYALAYFKYLAQAANMRSQLSSVIELNGRLRDPRNLPSYGFLNFNTSEEYKFKLNEVFDNDSPFILLEAITNELQHLTPRTTKDFIDCLELHRYIKTATRYHNLDRIYESIVQQSIPNQCEVHIISRSLLMISRYYLKSGVEEPDSTTEQGSKDVKSIDETRAETFSQLCYCAASVVCLLSRAPTSVDLKDQLIVKILFDEEIHFRAARETFNQVDRDRHERPTMMLDVSTGRVNITKLSKKKLQALLPVYQSCEQPNRFWVLQPLLEYYEDQVKEGFTERSIEFRNKWFRSNITPTGGHTTDFNGCSDVDVISTILLFNYEMMRTSPAYLKLVVQPNFEDYSCAIGSIFLDDDLFLDQKVSIALQWNLRIMLTNCLLPNTTSVSLFSDASRLIRPLQIPLSDFFNKIVDQFESVSYGDETFANFLLLFMTQNSDKLFRKKLFQERVETCLSQLKICVESVLVPRELFYSRRESDRELKALMKVAKAYIPAGSFLSQYVCFHSQS